MPCLTALKLVFAEAPPLLNVGPKATMWLSALPSPTSSPVRSARFSEFGSACFRQHQLSERFTRPVGGGAARCSSPCLPPLARIWSMRRGSPRRKAAQCTKCTAELYTFGPLCRVTFVLAAAKLQQPRAACCGSGHLRLFRCRSLADKIHPPVFSTHRTHPQAKGSQQSRALARSTLC